MRTSSAYFPASTTVSNLDEFVDQRPFRFEQDWFANSETNGNNFPSLVSFLWHRQHTGFGTFLDATKEVTIMLFAPNVLSLLKALSVPFNQEEMAMEVVGFDRLIAQQVSSIGHQFLAVPSFVLIPKVHLPSSLSFTIPVHHCAETERATSSTRCQATSIVRCTSLTYLNMYVYTTFNTLILAGT